MLDISIESDGCVPVIVGYTVLYTTDPSLPDDRWSVKQVPSDQTSTVLRDLPAERTHYFKVRSQGASGKQMVSSTSVFKTTSGILLSHQNRFAFGSIMHQTPLCILRSIWKICLLPFHVSLPQCSLYVCLSICRSVSI